MDDDAPDHDEARDDAAVVDHSRPRRRGLVVGLALSLAVNVVLVVLWVGADSERDDLALEDRLEQEALVTAREFVTAFVNFDHQTIDEDFDRIISYATGEFLQEVASFNDPEVRNGIRENQTSSRGEIVDVWVQEVTGERARVFAIADQTIQNNVPRLTTDQLRMEIGLVRSDGRWQVFDVGLLQARDTIGGGGLEPVVPDSSTTTTTAGG